MATKWGDEQWHDAAMEALGKMAALQDENARLRAICDALLCVRHATSKDLYGYLEDDGVTPRGGGCIVCIGQRLDAENARLREQLALQSAALCSVAAECNTWREKAEQWHERAMHGK